MSPFGKIQGLYFNNAKEPDDVMWQLKQDIQKIMEEEGFEYIYIKCDNKEDYYKMLDYIVELNKDAIKISGTSKQEFDIIVEAVEDADGENEEEGEVNESNYASS